MAGNQHCNVVRPVCRSRRAHRSGLADGGRDLSISPRLAGGNVLQLAPDGFLKRRALHVERNVRAIARLFHRSHDPRQQPGEGVSALDQLRMGKPRRQLLAPLTEREAADTLVSGGDKHLAQRGRNHRPPDRHSTTSVAPC